MADGSPFTKTVKKYEKKKPSQGTYSFYFLKDGAKLLEIRDGRLEVTEYLSAWQLI